MLVIIDYGMGNLHSVLKACKRINVQAIVSSDPKEISAAKKIILPGVGHFKKGMENLESLKLIEILNKKVIQEKVPILGICLGMQLFSNHSEEGNVKGLGWIDAKTVKFSSNNLFKIPHIGWNSLDIQKESKLLEEINKDSLFYFVHSYHVKCVNSKDVLSITNYYQNFVSSIKKKNIYGVQFHPEKSHKDGLKILKNFIDKC
jgi:imidazole glycerol-phosphate synthase subunit HisH